jgi:tRNA A-37 threonylcarbamoyl transferase component Bud32
MADPGTKDVGCLTLAEHLSKGPIPVEEALQYATLLGEALRKMHDSGRTHGAVSPKTILLTAQGIALTPSAETAGRPIDISADIFAFGAVLAEMLTRPKRPLGIALVHTDDAEDHGIGPLIAACVARDPACRLQTIHKALLEVKLAKLSVRRSGRCAPLRRDSEVGRRAGTEGAEARQELRIPEHEMSMADTVEVKWTHFHQRAEGNTSDLDGSLQRLGTFETELAGRVRAIERDIATHISALESARRSLAQTDDLIGRVMETVESQLAAFRRTAEENAGRLEILEQAIKTAGDQNAMLEARLADGMRRVESQAAALESVHKSMAQTGELIERVMEAVESIPI